MGELDLDKIDRALMQERKRGHDGCWLGKPEEAINGLPPKQEIGPHHLWFQPSSDDNCARTHQR
jgi:hypothetical protein